MASLSCQSNGTKVIQFLDTERRRRTIRLGKMSKRDAERFKIRLESLIFSRRQGYAPDEETAAWLTKLDRQMLERLANVDLIAPPGETLLIPFIENYIAKRKGEMKPTTVENWNNTLDHARGFFSPTIGIRELNIGHAEDFHLYLKGKGLAESTARKTCSILKQFLSNAVEHELIVRNPFRKITSTVKASGKNKRFITQETIKKVLEACPNAELRAIIALARFGGVRIPSEIDGLKWEHILWDESKIVLPSPKTERHEGRDKRAFPLFPELRPYLEEFWEPGAVYVCEMYRNRKRDLRRVFENAIALAGLKPWPVLFHNLRSSRQTELEEEFPTHVVCAWLGNTPRVAHEHYLQVTEEHFERATKCSALHNALHEKQEGSFSTHEERGKDEPTTQKKTALKRETQKQNRKAHASTTQGTSGHGLRRTGQSDSNDSQDTDLGKSSQSTAAAGRLARLPWTRGANFRVFPP